jgi:hypothetical protein
MFKAAFFTPLASHVEQANSHRCSVGSGSACSLLSGWQRGGEELAAKSRAGATVLWKVIGRARSELGQSECQWAVQVEGVRAEPACLKSSQRKNEFRPCVGASCAHRHLWGQSQGRNGAELAIKLIYFYFKYPHFNNINYKFPN